MKLSRFLFTRFAVALALGCALLAFAPLASADGVKISALNDAALDKMGKFFDILAADADTNAEFQELGKNDDIGNAVKAGTSVNAPVSDKYPKTTAALKKAGYAPDDFFASFFSLIMAAQGSTDGVSDPVVAKANITYFQANQEKIMAVMSKMK